MKNNWFYVAFPSEKTYMFVIVDKNGGVSRKLIQVIENGCIYVDLNRRNVDCDTIYNERCVFECLDDLHNYLDLDQTQFKPFNFNKGNSFIFIIF